MARQGSGPTRGAAPLPKERVETSASTVPLRTCVACRKQGTREELVRLVEGPDGAVAVDVRARGEGRGAWIHPTRSCIEITAKRHAAERALKMDARNVDAAQLLADTREAFRRKVLSLLGVAMRTRMVTLGAEATAETLERVPVPLLLVARDAGNTSRAVGDDPSPTTQVRLFGTKQELGGAFGRAEVAIAAVTDNGIAAELLTSLDRLAGLEG